MNTVWWLSKTPWPKSNVSRVLAPYSDRMKKLIEDPDQFFRPKQRPSGHDIAKSFGKNNGGAIPPNLLTIANSESNGRYLSGCKTVEIKAHPARFPSKLPAFFIRLQTGPGDKVLDIFAGSNTTGEIAQCEGRRWLAFEERADYVASSAFRFLEKGTDFRDVFQRIRNGESLDLSDRQTRLQV